MVKKTKKSSSKPKPLSEIDLKSLIHEHSQFFDNLVEQIPARFYLSAGDEKPWFQGLSKVAKASAKKETRENIKKARRARLDPEKASTTLDLLKKSIDEEKAKEAEEESDEEEEIEFEMGESKKPAANQSATYEGLRERLRLKIEELRSKRNAENLETPRTEKRRVIREGKRKRYEESEEGKSKLKSKEDDVIKGKKIEEEVVKATEGLTFGHVKLGSEEELGGKKKRKKLSKEQALEEAKKLQEVKKDPEQGKKYSWKAATSKAAGIKVHDDPKLIKQSMKKEKKKHEKNVEKWKERVDSRDKVRAEKQQKRSGNIADRIHDKKMRRIAKREKKLMRPGFEGRKEGHITKS